MSSVFGWPCHRKASRASIRYSSFANHRSPERVRAICRRPLFVERSPDSALRRTIGCCMDDFARMAVRRSLGRRPPLALRFLTPGGRANAASRLRSYRQPRNLRQDSGGAPRLAQRGPNCSELKPDPRTMCLSQRWVSLGMRISSGLTLPPPSRQSPRLECWCWLWRRKA